MKVTFDNEFDFIPEWNENQADEKPIKARFQYLTTPQREKFISIKYVGIESETRKETSFDYEGILRASLISLENCEINGIKITNANELIAFRGLSQLVRELADHAAGMNITPDLKN